jgi:hypothetical protein
MHGLFPTWATNNEKKSINSHCTKSSKLTLAIRKDELSSTIFASGGIYIDITHFVGLIMLVQRVFTFFKILFPFLFIKLITSLKNSRCHFWLWKKKKKEEIKASPLCVSS